MPDLLLELLSEEIPARMQKRAADDLQRFVSDALTAASLSYDSVEAHSTPRRLALSVTGLPDKQPDLREERRGPRVDAPEKAIAGFLGSAGLTSVDECETRETDKGTFLFIVTEKKGEGTTAVLPGLIAEAVHALSWAKSMRWAGNGFRWVRPLHSVLAVFDGKRLDGQLDLQGATLAFTDRTCGHRFMAPDAFPVAGFVDYKAKLTNAKVMLDRQERRGVIERGLAALAQAEGLAVRDDPGLLDEVAGLVEWPVVLTGDIDQQFMELPAEVLTSSMRSHQKYFSLLNADGELAPRFGVVANMETADGGAQIVAGNERVLRARLADAKFFWDQDRKHSLSSCAPALKDIVFHAKLGTLDEKVDRVQALATDIADWIPGADKDRVRSAARLCKADLVTGMVGEFPDLQGIMGRYYAQHDGEHDEVADAIAEHYAPQGPGDRCPTAPVSVALALADKIDTLVSFWLIDEKPTGSRDPFALRRAALGVIRLLVENDIRLPLRRVFATAQENTGSVQSEADDALADLLDFFADRLKVHLREQGVRHDLITAVFALGGEDDLVRLLARVEALAGFLGTEDGSNLLVAYKRAANIVRIEEKKDKESYNGGANPKAFTQDEEEILYRALETASATATAALEAEDFTGAMTAMSDLRAPVDAFFDQVTVNAEDADVRANRLQILSEIGSTLHHVADFSKIEG